MSGVRVQAQSFNPNYNFKHLNVQNGLTQNIVYHFLQDSRGYMWVGTHNGLSLYDGIKVINFVHDDQNSKSIARNFISGIAEDSSGQVWVSNENGIERYNRPDNSFTHFGVDQPDGRRNYTYCQLLGFVSADELWFLETEKRTINFLDTKTGKTSFVSGLDATNAQFYKSSGQTIHIWSSYDKGTIHQVYKNKKLIEQQSYFSGKGQGVNAPGLEISHVFQQNDSVVWLSANEGLVRLNPLTNAYRVYNKWHDQDVNEIR
ncbi:MAG TPA: two-component regulator propeller domain-containing protein, partial [Chitinophagaceae bacterium]|nr:two-component regulator propeller domain-containing protein [Chitinophagaceae bacterium]